MCPEIIVIMKGRPPVMCWWSFTCQGNSMVEKRVVSGVTASLFLFFLVQSSGGQTINLSIQVDNPVGPGNWFAFLAIDDPDGRSAGLAGISIDVLASGGARVLSAQVRLPEAAETLDFQEFFVKGFKNVRRDGRLRRGNVTDIDAAQDTISNGLGPTGVDAIIPGVGLMAVTEPNGALPDTVIDFPVLVAEGTYDVTGPGELTVVGEPASTILLPIDFPTNGDTFATFSPETVTGSTQIVPEPTVIVLLFFCGPFLSRIHSSSV